jgi:hypothetical protein
MPIKHQMDSYRTRGGVRYSCWEDVLEGEHHEQVRAARAMIADLRRLGIKAVYESHDDYVRVFAEADLLDLKPHLRPPGDNVGLVWKNEMQEADGAWGPLRWEIDGPRRPWSDKWVSHAQAVRIAKTARVPLREA